MMEWIFMIGVTLYQMAILVQHSITFCISVHMVEFILIILEWLKNFKALFHLI